MKNYLNVQNSYSESKLEKIAQIIKDGGIGIFPTETVYGIGTNALKSDSVERIYKIKKRDKRNPINLLINNMEMIEKVTQDISPVEYKLMENFFPGPFTIILKKRKIIPDIVTANSNLVGIRMPDGNIAKKLVELAGVPIAAPSANISGKLSGTKLEDIIKEFSNQIDFAIDGGECKIGMESTVVRVLDGIPHILRPGSITPEQIKKITGNVILDDKNSTLLPSSHMNHYHMDVPSRLIYSKENIKMINKIIELSKLYKNPIILCCTENKKHYIEKGLVNHVLDIGYKTDLESYSKKLFTTLRKTSSVSPDIVLIEGLEQKDLGVAIMNRLLSVCNEDFIELK